MGLCGLDKRERPTRLSYSSLVEVGAQEGEQRESSSLNLQGEDALSPFAVLGLCLFSLWGPAEGDLVSASHGEPHRLPAHLGVLHSGIAC